VDFRSFENNFEANAFFYDEQMALRLKQVFMEDQRHSILINDVRIISNRPFFYRLWESIVRLLAPLL
jgi:cardiolipin synthase